MNLPTYYRLRDQFIKNKKATQWTPHCFYGKACRMWNKCADFAVVATEVTLLPGFIITLLLKWKNSLVITRNAHQQLDYAYNRWIQIMNFPFVSQTQHIRIKVTAEVRAYLTAASQNLSNAAQLLHPATLPYCTHEEIRTLNTAITHIFTDAMNRGRLAHAAQVYITTRNRCGMLLQWIDSVIVKVLSKDFEDVRQSATQVRAELRIERIRLLQEKVSSETTFDVEGLKHVDSGVESDFEPEADIQEVRDAPDKKELDKEISEVEKDEAAGEEIIVGEEEKPVPLDELAPTPTNKELFGDLESIMADYERQKEEYNKNIATQEARQQMKLKEKLQRRRSRQNRMLKNQADLDKLIQEDKEQVSVAKPTEN